MLLERLGKPRAPPTTTANSADSGLTRLVPGGAVVTGASRGIGAACAVALGHSGASVVVNYHSRAEQAEAVVAEIRDRGGRAIAVQADVTSEIDVARLAGTARNEFGKIGIVVSNAAVALELKSFTKLTWADYQREFDAAPRAFFNLAKAFLPDMLDRGEGRLIGIGSNIVNPIPGTHAYVTAKAALAGMLRVLAREVGPSGVTVNLVTPALTHTDRATDLSDEFKKKHADRIPMKRLGAPEDVAGAVLYLSSELAGFVTGANLVVDGGLALT